VPFDEPLAVGVPARLRHRGDLVISLLVIEAHHISPPQVRAWSTCPDTVAGFVAQCEMRIWLINEPQKMTPNRHRNAWIWVAIAAMAVASVARAQAGIQSAAAYTAPVLEFLAGHPNAGAPATPGAPRLLQHRSAGHTKALLLPGVGHGAGYGVWQAILPVLFIGLITPLSLSSPKSVQCLGRTPSISGLPALFQRPPPAHLL
jgi:hypothetical protein